MEGAPREVYEGFTETCSIRHSLPFEWVPGIMVVRMVLHIVKFVNGFPRKGGVKHFSPGEIVTGRRLHADDLCLGFGIYCQVAENVLPRNSFLLVLEGLYLLVALRICQVARSSLLWILTIR